jgi:hypothetical protein
MITGRRIFILYICFLFLWLELSEARKAYYGNHCGEDAGRRGQAIRGGGYDRDCYAHDRCYERYVKGKNSIFNN